MLTNPSTLGVFERRIEEVAKHRARGRRPAVLRRREPQRDPRQGAPGRHGLRRHPHEPAQDVLDAARRRRPGRRRGRRERAPAAVPADPDRRASEGDALSLARREATCRRSIGRLSAFMGNAGVLLRAYVYMRMLGREGMQRVAEFATLNANYLLARLQQAGFEPPTRSAARATSSSSRCKRQAQELGVTAMDFAKRAARSRLPCADDVLPAAGAGVPADRADRDRERRRSSTPSSRRWCDPARSRSRIPRRSRAPRIPAGPPAGRRARRQATRPDVSNVASERAVQSCKTAPSSRGMRRLVLAFVQLAGRASRARSATRPRSARNSPWRSCCCRSALARQHGVERALLVALVLLVLIVELLNTASRPSSTASVSSVMSFPGLAKDIGSAAVLMSFMLLIVVWRWCCSAARSAGFLLLGCAWRRDELLRMRTGHLCDVHRLLLVLLISPLGSMRRPPPLPEAVGCTQQQSSRARPAARAVPPPARRRSVAMAAQVQQMAQQAAAVEKIRTGRHARAHRDQRRLDPDRPDARLRHRVEHVRARPRASSSMRSAG